MFRASFDSQILGSWIMNNCNYIVGLQLVISLPLAIQFIGPAYKNELNRISHSISCYTVSYYGLTPEQDSRRHEKEMRGFCPMGIKAGAAKRLSTMNSCE